MRKGLYIILIFIAAFVLYFSTYDLRSEQKQQYIKYDLTREEYAMLKDGDFILRHGYGIVSDAIVNSLNEKNHVSHVGVLVKCDTAPKNFRIVHCVSQSLYPWDGVQEQSFPLFLHDSQYNSIMVVRFKGANDSTRHKISEKALYYLEKRIPFDHSFDISDSSKFYCSELPWMILKNEFDVDIFKDKMNEQNDHMRFNNFWNPDYFEIIINHNEKR
ncbi:MAG: hypothetical protein GX259_05230 [Bacteroidales bacterium]|mgnify:CR=1 FL=1|nr:hypothetical protein [Bacteroidales bacterium]